MIHRCHWPGCLEVVPPRMWGCQTHWYELPKYLRDKIRKHYRPGQEIDKQVSIGYIDAAREVQRLIKAHR